MPTKHLKLLRDFIHNALEKRGWSERELARRSGLNPGTLNNALTKSDLQLSTLMSIAKGLDMSPAFLLATPDERARLDGTKAPEVDERLARLEQAVFKHPTESLLDQLPPEARAVADKALEAFPDLKPKKSKKDVG